ncbi:hypothetical protein N7U49_48520 (plasmid) [Streptomyces sp. AD2-2]|nr:hypothetical protein N7U49_48520 [Streptomyces sp. AD2-2]
MKQLMFQDDQQFWFETLRNLGLAVYGGLRLLILMAPMILVWMSCISAGWSAELVTSSENPW